ncbi:MAG: 3-dehydroquinate synthase [Cytophagales bacterium]
MSLSTHNIQFLDNSLLGLMPFFEANKYSKIAVLVDENTHKYCYPLFTILPAHQIIKIKSGERKKNLKTAAKIWQKLTDFELDRKSLLINIGGGVIGDMGGFCAATFKRGIDFVQIPTTLLSQVDASVGGKLGIDFNGLKNHIGLFNLPQAIFIYPGFLQTLSSREIRSGYAEIVKHCLIADANEWPNIQNILNRDIENIHFDWSAFIKKSIEIKENVVLKDPKEAGLRKILNFGHTLGHAVETYFLEKEDRKLLHGEAIAIGMIAEAWLSKYKGYISDNELITIVSYIISIYGKPLIYKNELAEIIPLTLQDKKNSFGKVKFSLLEKIGKCTYDIDISVSEMEASLRYYISL